MGDAKRRGSFEARVAAARAKIDAQRPDSIVCNGCEAPLSDVTQVDMKAFPGLDAVFVASCAACEADTFAAFGTPEALRLFAELLESNTPPESLVGARVGRELLPS